MARILLTIALALSTHGIVMGQSNKVNDETRSVFMNGQRIRTAMGNLIGKNGATKDAEASVDTLTRYLIKEKKDVGAVYSAFGKLGLYGYWIATGKTSLVDHEDIYQLLWKTRNIRVMHDLAYYVCCQELLSHCTQRHLYNAASNVGKCLLEYTKTQAGDQSAPYMETLGNLATLLSLATRHEEADSCLEVCQGYMEKNGKTTGDDYLDVLDERVDCNQSLNRMDKALALSEKLTAVMPRMSPSYLQAVLRHASMLYDKGDFQAMSTTTGLALKALEKGIDHERATEMSIFPLLANATDDSYALRMLNYAKKTYKKGDIVAAAVLAKSHIAMGQPSKAEPFAKEAETLMDAYVAVKDTARMEAAMPVMESLLMSTYQYDKLIGYWRHEMSRCLDMGRVGHGLAIQYSRMIADVLSIQGKYAKANQLLDGLLSMPFLADDQRKQVYYAKAQNELAVGNFRSTVKIGEWLLGRAASDKEAIDFRQNLIVGPLVSELDLRRNNIQDVSDNDDGTLLPRLKTESAKLLAAAESLYGQGHVNYIDARLLSMATLYFDNDLDGLRREALQCEQCIRKLGNEPQRKEKLQALAADYFLAGDYRHALDLAGDRDCPDVMTAWFDYSLKAECNLKLRHLKEARQYYIKFARTITGDTKERFATMPEDTRDTYWRMYRQWIYDAGKYMDGTKATPDFTAALYDLTLFSKGLLLNSRLETERIIKNSDDDNVKRMYGQLLAMRGKMENDMTISDTERQDLATQSARLEYRILTECQKYGELSRYLSADWKAIRQRLSPEAVAIEFVNYHVDGEKPGKAKGDGGKTQYAALLIRNDSEAPVFVPLFSQDQIGDTVSGTSLTTEMSALVWKPIMPYLNGIKTIFFSPSGTLNLLPIEYLPVNGKALSQCYDVYRLSSTRELLAQREPARIAKAVVYGGLEFDATVKEIGDARGERSFKFPHLDGTETEARHLEELLKEHHMACAAYHDDKGTETSFKQLSGTDFQLLHVGTHGFYRQKKSHFLDAVPSLHLGNITKAEDRSLYYSALIMAGINHAHVADDLADKDDGYLSAKEISLLDLGHVSLAVLSACQTGEGEVTGEGVFGLQRGFKLAGVKSLLMTAWKVSDEATSRFMQFFYTHLLNGDGKREALVKAQAELRECDGGKFASPRHWAAYILLDGMD